jgi:hypothetical protein
MALPMRLRMFIKPTPQGQGDVNVVGMLAFQIVTNPNISLARVHVSQITDHATARAEALQQMFGYLAGRSHYADGTHAPAPGGQVMLDVRMLRSVVELSRYYRLSIAEFAGGCHATPAHYKGSAFDVNQIDGMRVLNNHPRYREFMQDCYELGATKVIGPPSRGHETHVHAQWA